MATIRRHVKTIFQLRRATEQEWISVNPVLHNGEPALSTDKNKLKYGNGHSTWTELPYSGVNYEAGNGIDIENDTISLDDELIFDCGTSTTNV